MASYVDNNFRQAVMKNPVDRSPQVFLSGTSLKTSFFPASESPPLSPLIPFPSTVVFPRLKETPISSLEEFFLSKLAYTLKFLFLLCNPDVS